MEMNAYEMGRIGCRDGREFDDVPFGLSKENVKRWRAGWLDQYYGSKWEPKDEKIRERIWPVHL
jgi:hypothetical protein